MKIEDLYQIHYLGNLQLSPSKDKLSYVDIIADKKDDDYKASIYLRDLNNDQTICLTTYGKERSYKWMDEHTIIFKSNRDDKLKELNQPWTIFYKIDVRGGEACEYFRTPIAVGDFYFMENGKIATTCSVDYKNPFFLLKEEERAEYDKKQQEKASVETFTDAPFWANGAGIINGNRSIVAIIDPANGQITPLTPIENESHICDVKGNRILYLRHVTDGLRSITNGLYEYEEEEMVIVQEAEGHCNFAKYVGDSIVYDYATFEKYGLHQHGDIYIYRDGQIINKIKHDNTYGGYLGSDVIQQFSDGMIASDDGLYFLDVAIDRSSLKKLSLDGTIEIIYENDEEIDDIVFTGDAFYYLGNDTSHLVELYRLVGKEKIKLTSYHDALVNKGVGEVERITYYNDGVELYGFVMKPTDYDPNKKYPGVLNVHGGPKGTDGPAFKYGAQAAADRGYFVFYTNPRGADGRGNAFADIRGRFGKEDYFDLMAFTDAVLKAYPQIDGTKLGVTGLSYGGYMTNWIITQTDRFACAIAEASISNYVTKFLCTDIGFTYNISNQAADPWSDIDLVWEQSPLKYANKVKTPTMFIHSDEDYRCWIAEGVQMYTALKMHHVETKFMLFHKEHHGMSLFGKPSHRILRLKAMLEWFDEHFC